VTVPSRYKPTRILELWCKVHEISVIQFDCPVQITAISGSCCRIAPISRHSVQHSLAFYKVQKQSSFVKVRPPLNDWNLYRGVETDWWWTIDSQISRDGPQENMTDLEASVLPREMESNCGEWIADQIRSWAYTSTRAEKHSIFQEIV
jgi:hypothetical protein